MFCKRAAYVAAQFTATTVCNENHKLILSILPSKLDASVAELFVSTGSRLWALRLQNNGNDSLWKKNEMKKKETHTALKYLLCGLLWTNCMEKIHKLVPVGDFSVFTSSLNML